MSKKIKHRTKSKDELEAEKQAAEEERAREEAGIQDEFQAKGFELVEWAQDHKNVILGFIGLIIVVGAVLSVVTLVRANDDGAASAMYADAMKSWEAEVGPALPGLSDDSKARFETAKEKAEKAHAKFVNVIETHPGTGAAALAQIYAGHAAIDLADWDSAIKHYSAYIEDHGRNDELLFAALSGRAAAYESKGDADKAIADQKKLLELGISPTKDAAMLSLARLHLEKGDKKQAKEYLDQLEEQFPASPTVQNAEALRARLGDEGAKEAG